jgi:hypothetical protein
MSAKAKSKWILSQIGDPRKIAKDLRQYRSAAKILSSDHPRLVESHPKKWVVVYGGQVKIQGSSLDQVLEEADKQKLPKDQIIVRYLEKHRKTMILPVTC